MTMAGHHHTKEWKKEMSKRFKGRIFSKDTRDKISKAMEGNKNPLGRVVSETTRRKIGDANKVALLGRHLSDDHKKNISKGGIGHQISEDTKRKIRDAQRGENCKHWKGGISYLPYCQKFNKEFKERIRAFFDYKCVECGKSQEENGMALSCHHVNYDKMVCCNDKKPLFVALCHSHNVKVNTNRAFWEDWFTEIINEFYGGKCYFTKEEMLL
jgi:hypothetical protein